MKTHDRAADEQTKLASEADVQKERREFLEKCGRFAAYTTPAVLLLLHGTRAQAAVSGT